MNYSVTIVSLAVGVVGHFLAKSGFVVSDVDLQTTLDTLILIVSAVGVYYGRYRQGDINWMGKK